MKHNELIPGALPESERTLRQHFLEEAQLVPGAERIARCLQCGTCTGSCPVSYAMDISPRKVIALFRAGEIEQILRSRTIWICASCYMCTTRCPQGIKITDVLYALRRTVMDAKLLSERSPVYLLSKTFVRIVNRYGRNQEILLVLRYYLRRNPLQLLRNLPLAISLLRKGRLSLFLSKVRDVAAIRKILGACPRAGWRAWITCGVTGCGLSTAICGAGVRASSRSSTTKVSSRLSGGETPLEYVYYPGCSLERGGKSYDESLRAVFRALGVRLTELKDWNCCGATVYMSVDETVSLAISARNLALAEMNGNHDLIAPCSACYTALLKTNRFLRESPELKAKVDRILGEAGLKYSLTVAIRHPLEVLINDIGIEAIAVVAKLAASKELSTQSLEGVAFAPYYGCQIVRPERGFDDREFPTTMDRLFERLGADPIYFPVKTRCCGGMLMTTFPEVSLQLAKDLLECATENQAECIVTTCPLCQMNLEAYQQRVNKKFGTSFQIPVLFFTQLLGLALGCSEQELGLQRNLIPFRLRAGWKSALAGSRP